MAEIITDDDRISELPEFIIHHIMSFLKSPKMLVRMSVLSKKWFAITASFPILRFHTWNRWDTESSLDESVSSDLFFKYVDYTTTRFCDQNVVSAHTFSLHTPLHKPSVEDVDKCLRLILTKGVQVLDIRIMGFPSEVSMYRLPNLLLSVSSLTSLTIGSCKFPSSLMVIDVKFKSLKILEFLGITFNEELIKRLITSCPLLEEFYVNGCKGFKTFCVYGLEHLQKIQISNHFDLERIDIEAQNLWSFVLFDLEGKGGPCMNLASCKKLTTVRFFGYTSNGSSNLLSNFPFVEDLVLTTDKMVEHSNKLKLSSNSLAALVLYSDCDIKDIEINTPNLLLFKYIHDPCMCDLQERNLVESKARLECYTKDDVDTLWFLKLKQFLEKNNAFKVLKLHISTNSIDVEELKAIQLQPNELEHVDLVLDVTKEFSSYAADVDAVLLCCRPQSLSLSAWLPIR